MCGNLSVDDTNDSADARMSSWLAWVHIYLLSVFGFTGRLCACLAKLHVAHQRGLPIVDSMKFWQGRVQRVIGHVRMLTALIWTPATRG